MIPRWSDLTATVKLIVGAVAALLIIIAAWLLYAHITAKPKAEAKLAQNQTQAAQANGTDAVNASARAAARDTGEDDLSRTNAKEIHDAKGSDATVDPASRDAALRSLCRRRAYSGDPKCVQLAPTH